jgi:asparagine synthetase B (glutamine-hydrolysing)
VTAAALSIPNLLLRDDGPLPADTIDVGTPARSLSAVTGHFALHLRDDDDRHLLVRDPLGVNKLFYAVTPDGDVRTSNYAVDLLREGQPMTRIQSVPLGHLVRLSPSRRAFALEKYANIPFADSEVDLPHDLTAHATRIRSKLEATFRTLAQTLSGRSVYVTMSGGLDSTGIAVMARRFIGEFVGVTFRVEGGPSADLVKDDLHYARSVAQALGVPLEVVTVSRDALLSLIDSALVDGQDYRDFNVHCGLVNVALADALTARFGSSWTTPPAVLTGDTMNEIMADYSPVAYGAREYYGLPRVSIGRMRRILVSGLDSGDREVGVFARRGIQTIQPYALCADAYCQVPAALLTEPTAKQRLARAIFGDRIPGPIYARPKVRAQVGSSDEVGGTLAALVDQGVDAAALERRFCELHGLQPADLKAWIRGGYYRFTSVYPLED